MPNVGVGQQDAGQRAIGRAFLQGVHLLPKVGGGIDQPALPGGAIRQAQAGHPLAPGRVSVRLAALVAGAAGLGQASILGGAQQDRLNGHIGVIPHAPSQM
jgi:hypothetical protein